MMVRTIIQLTAGDESVLFSKKFHRKSVDSSTILASHGGMAGPVTCSESC